MKLVQENITENKFYVHHENDLYWFADEHEELAIEKKIGTLISDTKTEQDEPKVYCIKRTPENAEMLNKWINSLNENTGIETNFRNNSPIYFYSESVTDGAYSNAGFREIIEGFTELHTVEEFFSKVGYIPEPTRNEAREQIESNTKEAIGKVFEAQERIPFDLKLWETNKYDVINGYGEQVEILRHDLNSEKPIVAIHKGDLDAVIGSYVNGKLYSGDDTHHAYDLFLIIKKETVWVNVYHGLSVSDTKEGAFVSRDKDSFSCKKYIETIEVTRPIK